MLLLCWWSCVLSYAACVLVQISRWCRAAIVDLLVAIYDENCHNEKQRMTQTITNVLTILTLVCRQLACWFLSSYGRNCDEVLFRSIGAVCRKDGLFLNKKRQTFVVSKWVELLVVVVVVVTVVNILWCRIWIRSQSCGLYAGNKRTVRNAQYSSFSDSFTVLWTVSRNQTECTKR